MADRESSDWDEGDDDIQQLLLRFAQDSGLQAGAVTAAAAAAPPPRPTAIDLTAETAQLPAARPAPAAQVEGVGRGSARTRKRPPEGTDHAIPAQALPPQQQQQPPGPRQQPLQQPDKPAEVVCITSEEDDSPVPGRQAGGGPPLSPGFTQGPLGLQQLPRFEVAQLATPPRKRRARAAAVAAVAAVVAAEAAAAADEVEDEAGAVWQQQQQQEQWPPENLQQPERQGVGSRHQLLHDSSSRCGVAAGGAAAPPAGSRGRRGAAARADPEWEPPPSPVAAAAGSEGAFDPHSEASGEGLTGDALQLLPPLPAAAGSGPDSRKGRGPKLTAEERAAQKAAKEAQKAAEKAQKAADKAAQKAAAKQQKEQAAAEKQARREAETTSSRMDSTDHAPATLVVVWDAATAASKLGGELAAAMEGSTVPGIKRWCCYQVVPTLPLSGLAGCRCFLFKRRKMTAADFHNYKVGGTVQLSSFTEDLAVPMVQLVYDDPAVFAQQLMGDNLGSVLAAAAAAHPESTLSVGVIGLDSWAQKEDTKALKQGTVFPYPRPQLQERLLQLTLTAPPLLLRKLPKQQHALYHITYLARQLAMQPLQDPDKMEACAAVPDINALLRSAEAAGENVGPATRTMIGALSLMRSCGISHAWSIVDRFHGLGCLMAELDAYQGPKHKLLQDLGQRGNPGGRRLGPAVSKRLVTLLTSTDPDELLEGPEEVEEGQ